MLTLDLTDFTIVACYRVNSVWNIMVSNTQKRLPRDL